jgi:hypothetical protein
LKAVLIFAWNRPRYLRVCLDSISASGLDVPVIVSYDGPENEELQHGRISKVARFKTHVGNLWHVVRSIDFAFESGFESILLLDCDMIVRKDISSRIQWELPPGIASFICENFSSCNPVPAFSPLGSVITRESSKPLIEYCYSMKWVGTKRPWHPDETMGYNYSGYDAVFLRYMLDRKTQSIQSDVSLVGHIGLVGVDNNNNELEKKLFSGPPESWLSNAVNMFDPSLSPAFVPAGFKYE